MDTSIVILDGYTLNPGDLNWAPLLRLGRVRIYPRSSPAEGLERAQGAAIVVVNKFVVDEAFLAGLPDLRMIAVTATGINNIDLPAAKRRGIAVSNVRGYGTESVAQHVFAALLALLNRPEAHHQSVIQGRWSAQPDFSYWLSPITELSGKTFGIYGYGAIGRAVARIARAFGMEVLVCSRQSEPEPGVTFVDLETLFRRSLALSLHATLTPENAGVVAAPLLSLMPPGSYLINTSRGGLVNEADLLEALTNGPLAAAALDVLAQEPPPPDHPLLGLPNCLVTPHMAWAARASRERLLQMTADNVGAFLRGEGGNL
jgi:glycerate dehydrogenase